MASHKRVTSINLTLIVSHSEVVLLWLRFQVVNLVLVKRQIGSRGFICVEVLSGYFLRQTGVACGTDAASLSSCCCVPAQRLRCQGRCCCCYGDRSRVLRGATYLWWQDLVFSQARWNEKIKTQTQEKKTFVHTKTN